MNKYQIVTKINLKLKKIDEDIIKMKTKYSTDCILSSIVYDDINKIDEKLKEMQKLVDNSK
tara:strand:- start:219 stop:401 length:183 start_codon:yes stop_codon:yes gene_type:complete